MCCHHWIYYNFDLLGQFNVFLENHYIEGFYFMETSQINWCFFGGVRIFWWEVFPNFLIKYKQSWGKSVRTSRKRKENVFLFQKFFLYDFILSFLQLIYLNKFVGFVLTLTVAIQEKTESLAMLGTTLMLNLFWTKCSTHRETSNFFYLLGFSESWILMWDSFEHYFILDKEIEFE